MGLKFRHGFGEKHLTAAVGTALRRRATKRKSVRPTRWAVRVMFKIVAIKCELEMLTSYSCRTIAYYTMQ